MRIVITHDPGAVTIAIPERFIWLYVAPSGLATALLVALLFVLARALVLDLRDGRFDFGGALILLLATGFTAAFGYVLLFLTTGRQVLTLRPGSLATQVQILGRGVGTPDVYDSPIKDVRVEPSTQRNERGGFLQVVVDFKDEQRLTIRSFLEPAEADELAKAIRARGDTAK